MNEETDEERLAKKTWIDPDTKLPAEETQVKQSRQNVQDRHLLPEWEGFGRLWERIYRVRMVDRANNRLALSPEKLIEVWKNEFSDFWPGGSEFYKPLGGLRPGEVALFNLSPGGGIQTLSSGVQVIQSDQRSFRFMTVEGHPIAGTVDFRASIEEGITVAEVDVLGRPGDPVYEVAFRLTRNGKLEDLFWQKTLQNLADRFGAVPEIETRVILRDGKLKWRNAKKIFKNSGARTIIQKLTSPVGWMIGRFKKSK